MSIFKFIADGDVTNSRTNLHEHIPITGALLSGTYGGSSVALGSEQHIKNYSHGMFQSVYDYPYLSSSANHIMDIAAIFSAGDIASANSHLASGLSGSAGAGAAVNNSIGQATQQEKKINMYNQMAQVLSGFDLSGSIANFDQDGIINNTDGEVKINSGVAISLARLLVKDEIKKGSFELSVGVGDRHAGVYDSDTSLADTTDPAAHLYFNAGSGGQGQKGYLRGTAAFQHRIKISDGVNAKNQFLTTSPSGEFGVLYAETETSTKVLSHESSQPYYVHGKRDGDTVRRYFYPMFLTENAAKAFSSDGTPAATAITIVDLPFGSRTFYMPNAVLTDAVGGFTNGTGVAQVSGPGVDYYREWSGPPKVGLIYYQAGVVVLTSSLFQGMNTSKGRTTDSAAAHHATSPNAAATFGVDRVGNFQGLLDPGAHHAGPYFVVTRAAPTIVVGNDGNDVIAARSGTGDASVYGNLFTNKYAAQLDSYASTNSWTTAKDAVLGLRFKEYPGLTFYVSAIEGTAHRIGTKDVAANTWAKGQSFDVAITNADDSDGSAAGFNLTIDGVVNTLFGTIYSGASPSGSSHKISSTESYLPNIGDDFVALMTGSNISSTADFLRSRIYNLQFNNTTELNSQLIRCEARNNEFNHSSNRTYLDGSQIRVMEDAEDNPRTYITTVGLYDHNNELMAVAKLSEPLRKDPDNNVVLRVRLDY